MQRDICKCLPLMKDFIARLLSKSSISLKDNSLPQAKLYSGQRWWTLINVNTADTSIHSTQSNSIKTQIHENHFQGFRRFCSRPPCVDLQIALSITLGWNFPSHTELHFYVARRISWLITDNCYRFNPYEWDFAIELIGGLYAKDSRVRKLIV